MKCFIFWYHYKHIFGRKNNWVLLIDLLKVKNNILHYRLHSEENDKSGIRVSAVDKSDESAIEKSGIVQCKQLYQISSILFQITTQKESIQFKHQPINVHWTFLVAT